MLWSIFFAGFIIIVAVLKYLFPRRARCPQCYARRRLDEPLCSACGWIWEVPGEEDEEDEEAEPEQEELWY